MPNIFWNANEKRVRSLWRILIQLVIFIVLLTVFQAILGAGISLAVLSSGVAPGDAVEMITTQMLSSLWVRTSTAVASLIAMLLSYMVMTRIDKRPFKAFGFRFSALWWKDFAFGLFLGAILMALIFAVERAMGWVRISGTLQANSEYPFALAILFPVVTFLCVGIYEEMLSRGYQLRNLAEGLESRHIPPKAAVLLAWILTSSFFGLLHASNPNATLVSTVMLMLAGLFLGLGYILTGELALPIALHITWNFFQGNVFGFPVSGSNAGATFIAIVQEGPDLWTGGMFGPEAGLIGMIAILLGMLLTLGWVKWTRRQVEIVQPLAVYQPEGRFAAAPVQAPPPAQLEG